MPALPPCSSQRLTHLCWPCAQVEPLPTVLPAVPRLVAVGDLHGDLPKARHAFRLAGLIDEQDRWVGGTTTVVQASLHWAGRSWVASMQAGVRWRPPAGAGAGGQHALRLP